jgi:hypothetical protein
MALLSEETAKKQYDNLIKSYHYDREPEKKIDTFQQDLVQDILKEITGLHNFYSITDPNDKYKPLKQKKVLKQGQHDWLLKNEKRRYKGFIPSVYISDIKNLKEWRNITSHPEDNIVIPLTQIKYESFIGTMAQTINFFSEIPVPDEINKILNNRSQINNTINNETENKPNPDESVKRRAKDSYKFIKENVFSKIKTNISLYDAKMIFLKELCIDQDTDMSVYQPDIRHTLEQWKKDIYSIIDDILISIKRKKSIREWVSDDVSATIDELKNSIKNKSISGGIKSISIPSGGPGFTNPDWKKYEHIDINKIKLIFKDNFNKNIKWKNLLDKVLEYHQLDNIYNKNIEHLLEIN